MTTEEAKIVLLEDALRGAQNLVEFLHNCLTNPYDGEKTGFQGYEYAYPDRTITRLEEWEKLAPRHTYCFHGRFQDDCDYCKHIREEEKKIHEAKVALWLIAKDPVCERDQNPVQSV